MYRLSTQVLAVAFMASQVLAQSTATAPPANLPGFLSAVQSLASELGPMTTSSSSSVTSTSSPSNSSPSTTSSLSSAATSAATSAVAASDGTSSGGIDARTRNIILGVTIPVGILLLLALALLLFCCCRRRRRRSKRVPSPESAYVGNKEWERGNTSHHGYSNTSVRNGHSNEIGRHTAHDAAPLIGTTHHSAPPMSEHPAHRSGGFHQQAAPLMSEQPARNSGHHAGLAAGVGAGALAGAAATHHHHDKDNIAGRPESNPFMTPISRQSTPPITRKPVPARNSTGSGISSLSGRTRDSHHAGMAAGAAGAGALAGAAAMHHHHDRENRNSGPQSRPESWHRPLSSHPSNPAMYATADIDPVAFGRGQRRSSTPFSPDDVGAVHRSNPRLSHGAVEPSVTDHYAQGSGAIIAPSAAQRRSLQSRHSSYSDGHDDARVPSRSPKRRSLTGGGDLWQVDPVDTASLPSSDRYSGVEPIYTNPTAPPVIPYERRHSGSPRRSPAASMSPALPSNRHNPALRRSHLHDSTYGSHTDSSTSNDSYESAHADLDPWNYDDPSRESTRYPRFSGGSVNTMAPLIPSPMGWDERQQRRGSGGNRVSGDSYKYNDRRRSSGASERKQRLRFSEGHPELYNEHGLVGQAL